MKTLYQKRSVKNSWDEPEIDVTELMKSGSGWVDTLVALIENGPVDDGNIPSKLGRNVLIQHGYASYVIINRKEAGAVATYKGALLYRQLLNCDYLEDAIRLRQTSTVKYHPTAD